MAICKIIDRQGLELQRFDTESRIIGPKVSVGRSSECTVVLKHEAGRTVSRVHFLLERGPTGWTLANKSDSHGTYKGDVAVDKVDLQPGDVFRFGCCFFCFGEEAGPTPYQLCWEDAAVGNDYALLWPGRNSIGAATDNTIVVKADSVSRQHARITVTDGDIYVEDLNSAAGTFVNGKRVTALTKIADNAQLRIGKVRAWLKAAELGAAPGTGSGSQVATSRDGRVSTRWLTAAVVITILIILAAMFRDICL